MPLEILACGFNALGQLLPFDSQPLKRKSTIVIDDLDTPTVVAKANRSARVLFAGWSDTLLEIDNNFYLRGADARQRDLALELPDDLKMLLLMAFGDHISLKGLLINKHGLYLLRQGFNDPDGVCFESLVTGMKDIIKVAIAGNGKFCIVRGLNKISLYKNYQKFVTQQEPEDQWDFSGITERIIDLKSNETAFTILTAVGTVYTFGDPRHNHLGRDLNLTPGIKPGLVDALDGIRIAKISSGGWVTAALSVERDLYIWGGRAGDKEQIQGLQGLSPDAVDLVNLGGGLDVASVSVGAGHLVALTVDGRVWAVGKNDNGQIGPQNTWFQGEWKEIQIPGSGRAVEVVCGGWSTFIIVDRPHMYI